jgi:hypothetical protein
LLQKIINLNVGSIDRGALKFMTLNLVSRIASAIAQLYAIIILVLVHAPFGILNPGSAIRWRVNFELIFYMAPLLLFLEAKKNDY